MKLYYAPGACSFAPHIVLEEIGAEFTPVLVSLRDNAHRKPDFLRINPHAQVPVLQIDDFVLTENAAILIWLARRHADRHLMPTASYDEARALEWLLFLAGTVHIAFTQAWRPERYSDEPAAQKSVETFALGVITRLFDEIEAKLPQDGFLMGPEFTVADASLAVFYRWGWRMDSPLPMATRYPRWTALTRRLGDRPAVQRVLAREGISLFPKT